MDVQFHNKEGGLRYATSIFRKKGNLPTDAWSFVNGAGKEQ